MHHDRLVRIIVDAQERGAERVSASGFRHNIAGKCQDPVELVLFSRPPASEEDPRKKFIAAVKARYPGAVVRAGFDRRPEREKYIRVHAGPAVPVDQRTRVPLTLTLTVRCRRCDNCRRLRAMIWEQRARAEVQIAPRTWFGTLTLRPEAHSTIAARCRARLARQGIDFDALPFSEQFEERHRMIGVEITKYLKRVRKASAPGFRYLLVCEHHKSGLPHYHMLVHEYVDGCVKSATLASQWQLGFEQWRLLSDLSQATYLCKYLAKATVARVRASGGYGQGHKPQLTSQMIAQNEVLSVSKRLHQRNARNEVTSDSMVSEKIGG